MRVALTGAGGFTGRFVREALTAAGATCIALSADLTDRQAIDAEVGVTPFDRLIHLAAKAFVHADDWRRFYDVNQIGTFNLLEAVAVHRPSARCILSSSAQVYGPASEGLIDEDAPTRPANYYAVSKLAMEHGARCWGDRLSIVVTRPFNYTGVGQDGAYLIPKIVDHYRRQADTIELGNLWVRRDFGDVRDVAAAYAGLALSADTPPATLNISTSTVHSIDDILDRLSEISGHRPAITVNPAFVRANDVAVLGGDNRLLRAALPHWTPRPLADTLAWMYAVNT